MAERTNIEWADASWNPWHGCIKVSPGCRFCYMYREKKMYGQDPTVVVRSKTKFEDPLKWARGVGLSGNPKPKFIFTCSWSDFFITEADKWRAEAWEIIRQTPEFTYLILTKRPGRISRSLPADWGDGYPNVWLGTSAENQKYADQRIPELLKVPAVRRFLSLEPLLGPITFRPRCDSLEEKIHAMENDYANKPMELAGIDWVIVGGESGSVARPMEAAWVRSLREQCAAARRAFFFKQWGEWAPADAIAASVNLSLKTYDSKRELYKVGAEAAGNLLDGKHHLARPSPTEAVLAVAHAGGEEE